MQTKSENLSPNDDEKAINELQKYFLCEWISSIYYYDFDEKKVNPFDTVEAFQLMLSDEVSNSDRYEFKGLWKSIEKVRKIFQDPCPHVTLDLVKFNDKSGPAIKREAVVYHLRELIEEKISIISRQLGESEANIQKLLSRLRPPIVTFFQPLPQNDRNNPTIDKLNMTVTEFNEKFKNEFSIKEEGIGLTQGFWPVKNIKGEIFGVLVSKGGNVLKETELSERKHNFIDNIMQRSVAPIY